MFKSQEFTTDTTWNVPAGVSAVIVLAVGGGAGGPGYWNYGSGWGGNPFTTSGAGELVHGRKLPVTPGGTLSITIGQGGGGGSGTPGVGTRLPTSGTDTIVGIINVEGGNASTSAATPGIGGGGNPGIVGSAPYESKCIGKRESPTSYGGASGTSAVTGNGLGYAPAYDARGLAGNPQDSASGNGGAASLWNAGGIGGDGGLHSGSNNNTAGTTGTGYGSAAGSPGNDKTSYAGVSGTNGYVALFWMEP